MRVGSVDLSNRFPPDTRPVLPRQSSERFQCTRVRGERAVECASVPGRNRLIGHTETQEKPSSGKILKGGRLNSQCDSAPAVDVIDSRSQIQLPCARCDSGKKDQWISAAGLALPERAKARLLD